MDYFRRKKKPMQMFFDDYPVLMDISPDGIWMVRLSDHAISEAFTHSTTPCGIIFPFWRTDVVKTGKAESDECFLNRFRRHIH